MGSAWWPACGKCRLSHSRQQGLALFLGLCQGLELRLGGTFAVCGSGRGSCHLPSWPLLRCPSAEAGDHGGICIMMEMMSHGVRPGPWSTTRPSRTSLFLSWAAPFHSSPRVLISCPSPGIILPEFILLKIKSRKGRCLQANSASAL